MEYIVELDGVNKVYGKNHVVKDLDLKVKEGEFLTLLGSSGCGKTTTLRMIAGFEEPTTGTIKVEGEAIEEKEPFERNVNTVFQTYALFPHMTIADNIAYGLKIKKVPKAEIKTRVKEMIDLVQLSGFEKRYPSQLSGGQKQRVAIARAIANNPKILLCDEATSALDPQTTKSVLELLKQINRDYGITIVVVTHEMSVVQEICNQVAILNEGNVVETGSVSEIFTAPKSPEAKSLIIGIGSTAKEMRGRHCIRIVFKENSSYEPVVGNMTLQFKTPVNILYANTKDLNGTAAGEMILQLPEDTEIAGKMVEYLKEKNLYVGEVEQDVFI